MRTQPGRNDIIAPSMAKVYPEDHEIYTEYLATGTILEMDNSNNHLKQDDIWHFTPGIAKESGSEGQVRFEGVEFFWISGEKKTNKIGWYPNEFGDAGYVTKRSRAVTWVDNNGDLWMFGGQGNNDEGEYVILDDIWKYSIEDGEWIWVSGTKQGNRRVEYPSGYNETGHPGSRRGPFFWKDDGGVWIFGGGGIDEDGSWGLLSDLWKYDIKQGTWTWINGHRGIYHYSAYPENHGERGIPGNRWHGCAWRDNDNLWMFGGTTVKLDPYNIGNINELWKFDTKNNEWIWMGGSINWDDYGIYPNDHGENGYPSARNRPVSWVGDDGAFWLFGGMGDFLYEGNDSWGFLNDLWKYNPEENEWTWIAGMRMGNYRGVYPSSFGGTGKPGGRLDAVTWTGRDGNLYLYGGEGIDSTRISYLNDFWMFDVQEKHWIWLTGETQGYTFAYYPGMKGEFGEPGSKYAAMSWTDNEGKFWLFGGHTAYTRYTNDLWKYGDEISWRWMNSPVNLFKGIFPYEKEETGTPGGRYNAVSWCDTSGNSWIFGGYGYDGYGNTGFLNDLWRYDGTEWTWTAGSKKRNRESIYPENPGNPGIPGSRMSPVSWIDNNGDLWMFGGDDFDISLYGGSFNDLWKFDINNNKWYWMGGTKERDKAGIYDGEDPVPGGRYDAVSWKDSQGDFWLFGGFGFDASENLGFLNDLWKFEQDQGKWKWISGSKLENAPGRYPDDHEGPGIPRGRANAVSWTDRDGNFWLFGGFGYDINGNFGFLNDLWEYDHGINEWIWIAGSADFDSPGAYPQNTGYHGIPCARIDAASWMDNNGDLWLYGGYNGTVHDDFWKFDIDENKWIWSGGSKTGSQTVIYPDSPMEKGHPGSRRNATAWTDEEGKVWIYGGYGKLKKNLYDYLNDLWVHY